MSGERCADRFFLLKSCCPSQLYVFLFAVWIPGNYKVEMFDEQKNAFVPTLVGLGMLVEVRDPDDKELLSRVNLPIISTV